MSTDSTDAAWAAARAAEPDGMSRDEIASLLEHVRRARAWLDGIEMRAARRARELESVGRAESADSLLANASGRSGKEARSIAERSELCEQMPDVEDALVGGELPAGYVDAIAGAARGLPEAVRAELTAMSDELLGRASKLSLDAFRRECRDLAKHLLARARAADGIDELAAQRAASKVSRWVDRTTGMHHTHLELDPVRDAKLASSMQAEIARLRAAGSKDCDWAQLQVEAVVNSIAGITTPVASDESSPGGGAVGDDGDCGPGSRRDSPDMGGRCHCGGSGPVDRIPEITGLVSYEWLIGLDCIGGICETEAGVPIPISTMRRLCCDAEIIPTVLGAEGELLDHGRSRRTASRSQRRALRAMYRSCAHPDCRIGFDACRIHHIRWWWRDLGRTDLDNLLPLCERHHHLVHEGGWSLTMTPDRVATWQRPDGSLHHRGPTINRRDSALLAERVPAA